LEREASPSGGSAELFSVQGDVVDGHVDVGREDRDEQEDESPARGFSGVGHQEAQAAHDLEDSGYVDQLQIYTTQKGRHDVHEDLRVCKMCHAHIDEGAGQEPANEGPNPFQGATPS